MSEEEKFSMLEIGLTLNRIGLRLDDEHYQLIKDDLDLLEQQILTALKKDN